MLYFSRLNKTVIADSTGRKHDAVVGERAEMIETNDLPKVTISNRSPVVENGDAMTTQSCIQSSLVLDVLTSTRQKSEQ